MPIRVLDLFSGIGGFSFAFRGGQFRTVAYCEQDEYCKQILQNNIRKSLIDDAPIFDDVRTLDASDLAMIKPDMLIAGFPCQDISTANMRGKGIKGSKSGLFFEILRVIDECSRIGIVFLENSPHILHNGIRTIERAFAKRSFSLKYVIQSASDIGAPHKRSRWFALAIKKGKRVELNKILLNNIYCDWSREPCYRIVSLYRNKKIDMTFRRECLLRCSRLGNAIVPAAVVRAWNTLTNNTDDIRCCKAWSSDRILSLPISKSSMFPTPTHTYWNQYRKYTKRAAGVLGNFIYIEDDTYQQIQKLYEKKQIPFVPDRLHVNEVVVINPNFIEWMMGFPKNWTRTSSI